MTTVTGIVRTLKATALPGALLRWVYKSYPAYVDGSLVSSVDDVVTRVTNLGNFSETLTAGTYELTIDGNSNDKWTVGVPDDNASYDVLDLIVSPTTVLPTIPTPAVIPNASSTVAGKVKTTKDGPNIRVATGIWIAADVAELKTIPSDASNQLVFLFSPLAGQPKIVRYDPSSSAADDPTSFTIIKPTDNPATGRWIPFM